MTVVAKVAVAIACLLVGVAAGSVLLDRPPSVAPSQQSVKPRITLQAPKPVEAGAAVRLSGTLRAEDGRSATVLLQRRSSDRWSTVGRARQGDGGSYGFVRIFERPTKDVFRTVLSVDGTPLATSRPKTVTVRPSRPEGEALLPDLGAKKLTDCAASEQPCFSIVEAQGRRLLRFPMVTVNVGDGPVEIHGHRSSRSSRDWVATMTTHHSSGDKRSAPLSGVVFYWAGDGHNHWHIRDFDYYDVLDANGRVLRRGEKHGFCFEDNTTYRDWLQMPEEHPRVPRRPVYKHELSCGVERPNATSMVHGLSRGWADTYPTSLPDQNIDITGLPDGDYTVRVTVDGQRLVPEADESNNTATVRVRVAGNRVRVDAASATGL